MFSNIKNDFSPSQVQDIFSLHGSIKSVKKLTASKLDPKQFFDLLVEYLESSSVATAMATMNGHVLSGQRLDVCATSLSRAIELMVQSVESSTFRAILLENMVTFEDTKDPGLKDEIAEEAARYGTLVEIDITPNPEAQTADIKLLYADPIDATKAFKALSGRLFAGRKIKATLIA
jgi:hypothetical protein